jgi:uncharacterized protein
MTTLVPPSIEVPPINRRRRIPPEAIDYVIRQIAEKFQPLKIILFGSYAYGNPRPESDVDLLVVMETQLKEIQQEILICQQVDCHFGLDVIVKTPEDLKRRIALGDPFLQEIAQRGKVRYERNAG